MAGTGAMSSYWRGLRDGTPFLILVFPFGMLFGVVATESGLSVAQSVWFSVVVIAGASQFTALQLLNDNAPAAVALASALAVNLRMAMYSASLTPHLGPAPLWQRVILSYILVDQTYAGASLEYEKRPTLSLQEKVAYFFGYATPICPPWYLATWLGAVLGSAIPTELGLDFAVPIAFLAMIGPMLRTPAHWIAALVATVLALLFTWLPYNLGLMVAGIAGMMAGAEAERRADRPAAEGAGA